ncbi:hypothetical protein SBRCBS47491_000683 [Sporothrix bragantina]|uniref:CUE domain-containing protein n=1 Tax=Sporothrix bragantina TaxID=671064 RepID=A0ABP0ASD6_9PEZI
MEPALPPLAPFPGTTGWRQQIGPTDWSLYLQSWRTLTGAYLALPDASFTTALSNDEQTGVSAFLVSVVRAQAEQGPTALDTSPESMALKKAAFLLTARALRTPKPPPALLSWEFLADASRVYGRRRVGQVLGRLPPASVGMTEASLTALKKFLTKNMEAGLTQKGSELRAVEERLQRVNYLVSAWPAAGALFLTGSDYLDAMVGCFTIMNPPLRRVLVTSLYVCLVGLTEPPTPRYSLLSDLLYALRGAAEEHKKGPLRASDSLVAELVSVTPILQQVRQRAEAPDTGAGSSKNRILPILNDLATYRQPGRGMTIPPGRLKKKVDKGKSAVQPVFEQAGANPTPDGLHPHKMSQISIVQDLFPDLGSAFVAKLLDEYNDDTEQVVAHLLEGNLPPHLESADRSENLGAASSAIHDNQHTDMAPHATPPLVPARHNIFDGDELDELSLQTSKLHFGKQKSSKTADDVLADRSTAPKKAAIWSALAAFDADDDERDDTYDAADVGGTVDGATSGASGGDDLHAANEQTLFAAYQAAGATNSDGPGASDALGVFGRDAATRRSAARAKLREETGMTDEAIEGWAVMLARNPQQRRRLELQAQSGAFGGEQHELARTAWRAGEDDDDEDGPSSGSRGGFRGRGRGGGGRGRGGGGRGGNVAGPTGEKETEQARRRKEASKSSRANHNRRDQRARKMAKGGFPG